MTDWDRLATDDLSTRQHGDADVRRRQQRPDAQDARQPDDLPSPNDTLNRLKTKTPPSPAPVVSYAYDLAGRLTGISDASAAIAAAVPPSGTSVQYTTILGYDAMNRPTAVTWSPAPSAVAPTAGQTSPSGHGLQHSEPAHRPDCDRQHLAQLSGPRRRARSATPPTALNQYTAVGAVTPTYDGKRQTSPRTEHSRLATTPRTG
jgi:hypothetical protein